MDILATLVPPDTWKLPLLVGTIALPVLAAVLAVIEPQLPLLRRPSLLLALLASVCGIGMWGVNERAGDEQDRAHQEQVAKLQRELGVAQEERTKQQAAAQRRIDELERKVAGATPRKPPPDQPSGSLRR
jgi:hypothetical protein